MTEGLSHSRTESRWYLTSWDTVTIQCTKVKGDIDSRDKWHGLIGHSDATSNNVAILQYMPSDTMTRVRRIKWQCSLRDGHWTANRRGCWHVPLWWRRWRVRTCSMWTYSVMMAAVEALDSGQIGPATDLRTGERVCNNELSQLPQLFGKKKTDRLERYWRFKLYTNKVPKTKILWNLI